MGDEEILPPTVPTAPPALVEHPSPLTGVAHGGIVMGAAAVALVQQLGDGQLIELSTQGLLVAGLAAAALLIAFLYGVFVWRTTSFVVDDAEFRLERTFIWHSSSKVDYTKVQAVELAQPFIARLLGLAKVHVDVGGAGGLTLAYLTRGRAEALREHLLGRRARAQAEADRPGRAAEPGVAGPAGVDEPGAGPARPASPVSQEVLVHQMAPATLLLGTLVSNPALIGLFVAASLLVTSIVSGAPIAFLGAVVALGGWLWSNLGRNWGFRMTRLNDTLRITRGFASTTAQGLNPERIQGVAIHQDLLQRLTGLYRVSVTVLGFAESAEEGNGASNSVVLPYGTWAEVLTVLRAIWPAVDLSEVRPIPQPARARWLTPLAFSQHTWGVGRDVVVAHHGLLEHTLTVVPHRRMQSLEVEQGPLQRVLHLSTIAIHTTDGPVSLRLYHLDEVLARRMFFDQLDRAREARAGAS